MYQGVSFLIQEGMRATEITDYNSRRTVNGLLDMGSTPIYSITEGHGRLSSVLFLILIKFNDIINKSLLYFFHENKLEDVYYEREEL